MIDLVQIYQYQRYQNLSIISIMKQLPSTLLPLLLLALLATTSLTLYTSSMSQKRTARTEQSDLLKSPKAPVITTSCNVLNFTQKYDYSGIVASGYLTVGKNNSALAFTFYGRKDVQDQNQLRNIPTVLWLNGGPGSSSQLGNLQELGPLLIIRDKDVKVVKNDYTWANKYNLLFVDQPVGTGLSYADTQSGSNPFAKSMDQVANDFYRALYELYNGKGCFSSLYFNIPPSSPLVIFGQSYAGKYVPAISKKIVQSKQTGGFLTGFKGMAIGDPFTHPYDVLSEVGTFASHLGLVDFQEHMRLEKVLLNASRHNNQNDFDAMHLDFDTALDYVVERAGNINVYDIKSDGEYEEFLQPYFRDEDIVAKVYGLNPEVVYDSQAEDVYNNLFTDFMKPQTSRVQYLLNKGYPVLVYNGQDDLIVSNPGTMKWVDRLQYDKADQFRRQLFEAWKINGKIVGTKKSAGNLEFRIVFNAGHLVPMDRPAEALDMAISFVDRVTM